MFTGLVQTVGKLTGVRLSGRGRECIIEAAPWGGDALELGESIAVQGCCLTVTAVRENGFDADLLEETWNQTAFAGLAPGSRVNLERSVRPTDRMGGHFVQGHIDAAARFVSIVPQGRDWRLRLSCSEEAARYIVRKGSVALDGVSLTVSGVPSPGLFEVDVIPTTWRETSLSDRKPGDRLNLETDILGRYVEHFLSAGFREAHGVTEDLLRKAGFVP